MRVGAHFEPTREFRESFKAVANSMRTSGQLVEVQVFLDQISKAMSNCLEVVSDLTNGSRKTARTSQVLLSEDFGRSYGG